MKKSYIFSDDEIRTISLALLKLRLSTDGDLEKSVGKLELKVYQRRDEEDTYSDRSYETQRESETTEQYIDRLKRDIINLACSNRGWLSTNRTKINE